MRMLKINFGSCWYIQFKFLDNIYCLFNLILKKINMDIFNYKFFIENIKLYRVRKFILKFFLIYNKIVFLLGVQILFNISMFKSSKKFFF